MVWVAELHPSGRPEVDQSGEYSAGSPYLGLDHIFCATQHSRQGETKVTEWRLPLMISSLISECALAPSQSSVCA